MARSDSSSTSIVMASWRETVRRIGQPQNVAKATPNGLKVMLGDDGLNEQMLRNLPSARWLIEIENGQQRRPPHKSFGGLTLTSLRPGPEGARPITEPRIEQGK